MIYRKFKLDKKIYSQVSMEDQRVLKILEGAVLDLARVYEAQLKDGFYPKGVSKEKIEEAAKKNPSILSPFTMIETENGKFKSMPYYKKYKDLLAPVADKIDKAAKICSNPSFCKYLRTRAKSLRDGTYREADVAWFGVKNSNIDFSIGPFERYLDKMFFVKRAFQAHVGIIDIKNTQTVEKNKEVLYSSAKTSFDKYHSTEIPKKGVKILIEHSPVTSGYLADALFAGEHFPSDLDIMQKHGSRIIIYRSALDLKFKRIHHPIFKAVFEKRFASKYPKELLFRCIVGNVVLYELGRQLHKFAGSRERLKELYGVIDEANNLASGIQHSKYLVLKGLISQEELEAIIIMHILWMFADWLLYQKNKGKESHVLGSSILFNAFIKNGALKVQGGISWPNFARLFFEIEEMANQLVYLLYEGTYDEAKTFIKTNVDLKNFESLGKNLHSLNLNL